MAKPAQLFCLLALASLAHGAEVSPVQKVVELLESCKAKILKDLDGETKAMEEYTTFCDDELTEKGYAVKTAERTLNELSADIADNEAIISDMEAVIAETGTLIAEKDKELAAAASDRAAKNAAFKAAEAEMITSVEELARAAEVLKQGAAGGAFLQASKLPTKLRNVIDALKTVVDANRLDVGGRKRLNSFLQAAEAAKEDDTDLDLAPAQGTVHAIESHSGGILQTIEDMQEKAENSLSELRQNEMKSAQSYELIKQSLENELKNAQDKLASSTKNKATASEKLASAQADSVETKKSKAADEQYAATLKTECEQTAVAWEERQKSAKEEMGAIDKAKEILVSGVKALVQVKASTSRRSSGEDETDSSESAENSARAKVTDLLRSLARKNKSFALAQLASMSSSDPFVKIRGLIEDMIAKLVKEAQEEATHEAFCQEEMGKSKASKEEKEAKLEKHTNRIEEAEASIAELTKKIKTLESEIAEIDSAQAEATKVRTEEKTENTKAADDFRQSAEAVARAIEVLKSYYEGALLQVSSHKSQAPSFGGAKSDTGSTIISVLEMSQEDFTTLLAETEEAESTAAEDYEKLTQENKVSRASKDAEAKAAASEVKSTKVNLENYKEDQASVSDELDAVNAYLDKLKPECVSKAMTYQEKKAAREAEIEGLKSALNILSGDGM